MNPSYLLLYSPIATGKNQAPMFVPGFALVRAIAVALTYLMHFSWFYAASYLSVDLERVSLRDAGTLEAAWLTVSYYSLHGVYLFFMVSGFLIGRMWLTDPSPSAKTYFVERSLRIFPAFWAALAVSFVLSAWRGIALPSDILDIFRNAFLVNWFEPTASPPWLLVSWSLQIEWCFYIAMPVVGVALQAVRPDRRLLCVWGFTAVLAFALKGLGDRYFAYPLFFAVGITTVLKWQPLVSFVGALSAGWWLAGVALVQFVYALLQPVGASKPAWVLGPFDAFTAAYVIFGALLFVRLSFVPPRFAQWPFFLTLGRISYSFFLWHFLVLTLLFVVITNTSLASFFSNLVWPIRWSTLLTIGFAGSYAAALISYKLFEAPYFAAKRRALVPKAVTD